MVSVEEAKQILINAIQPLSVAIAINTADALGHTLLENVYAPVHLPPFNQSNVDGYAVKFSCTNENKWKVVGEIKAGDNTKIQLNEGEAARIFTGAMVPVDSDLVIMQERIIRSDDLIEYSSSVPFRGGENIRYKGMQINKGELAIEAGTVCSPAVIGFIASLGIELIKVARKPCITLVVTGNELKAPGTELKAGNVYESNSLSLCSAVKAMGLNIDKTIFVKDDKQELENAIREVFFASPDLLLVSGGISVGDYDFVYEALEVNGTVPLFYKVAQKPGKPLYFAKNKSTYVFGLPGNPGSALSCFYEYIYPALRKLQGKEMCFLTNVFLPVKKPIAKKKGLALFLKALAAVDSVEPLQGQESFKMKSFTDANAFIYLQKDREDVSAGELVEVHLLPAYN